MASLELEARLDNLLATAQTETANIDLFAPISEREECPICLITLPIKDCDIVFKICCGKQICKGCAFKHMLTDKEKGVTMDDYKCPFCQQVDGKTNVIKSLKRLMKKNNSEAYMSMAVEYKSGESVFQSDTKSLEMRICAAELGLAAAFEHIGYSYQEGIVVEQDESKALEFYEIAAKKGSVQAHRFLARLQKEFGNINESVKHWKVSASAGAQEPMDCLMIAYQDKLLTKEDLSQTLRAFQEARDLMKSKDRDYIDCLIARYNESVSIG